MDCSAISGYATDNVLPLTIGAGLGVLGCYAVQWLRNYYAPVSTAPLETLHIIHLTENGPKTDQVTLPQFRTAFSNEELNTLRTDVGWLTRTEKMWQEIFKLSPCIVAVEEAGQLVGYSSVIGDGRKGEIRDVIVRPDHQKQGIGTLMMNHLITQLQTKSYFSVGLSGSEDNQSFYEKFGFKPERFAMTSSVHELTHYMKV